MRRLPLIAWAVYLIAMPAAWATSGYTVLWPDRSADFRGLATQDVPSAAVGLTNAEQEAVRPLLDRRLSLRIRGLELRYTIGKTVSSEGADAASLASIRHQIESVDAEIAFIDQELSAALTDYSKRQETWLVISEDLSIMWFVPSQPCPIDDDWDLATNLLGIWQPVSPVADTLPIGVDVPGPCPSFRLAIDGLGPAWRSGEILLRVNDQIQRFLMPY